MDSGCSKGLGSCTGVADAKLVSIPADHLNMIKFASREDGGYKKVSGHLWLLAKEAADAINKSALGRTGKNKKGYGRPPWCDTVGLLCLGANNNNL